jgi:hypothetical protein
MKRLLAALLIMCMVALMLPGRASAIEGTSGENLTWTLTNGVLTISGSGPMVDYRQYSWAPWYTYKKSITKVIIGEGVTSIGEYAFYEHASITSITIPQSLTRSGYYAFYQCTGMKYVYYQGNLEEWCRIPFGRYYSNPMQYGSKLYINNKLLSGAITVPRGVTTLKGTFWGCRDVSGVILPDTITSIGDCAFFDCTGLNSVFIPDTVTGIGSYAFHGCSSLTDVDIPDGVTTIEDDAFSSCSSLTYIVFPEGLTKIGYWAFGNCKKLGSITIPASATYVGENAFSQNTFTVVHCTGIENQKDHMQIAPGGNNNIRNLPWHCGVRVCQINGKTVYDCPQCGPYYPDGTPYTPVTQLSLTAKSFSLSFEDEIKVNYYCTVSDMTEVTELGMLVFYEEPGVVSIDMSDEVCADPVVDGNKFMCTSKGIAAKNMGDTRYYCAYAKLSDGIVVYSDLTEYSPKIYAMNMLNKETTSQGQKALCVAMLNYGAAAQQYFGYRTGHIMNAELTDEQKALTKDYDENLFVGAAAVDDTKIGAFVRTSTGFSSKTASVSFDGALTINYYFTPDLAVDSSVTFYYWNAADYEKADRLAPANATGSTILQPNTNGTCWATIGDIAAKDLDDTYYVAAVYYSELTLKCTGVISYSLSQYCMNNARPGKPMQTLAAAAAMYGYYANQYFAN